MSEAKQKQAFRVNIKLSLEFYSFINQKYTKLHSKAVRDCCVQTVCGAAAASVFAITV